MPDNYYKTSLRNYEAAIELLNCNHFHVCCYLSGYVVESYAKLIIENFTSPVPHNHNLFYMNSTIARLVRNPSLGGLVPPKYIYDLRKTCPTILSGTNKWDPFFRYTDDETYWGNAVAIKYASEIKIIKKIIIGMKLDGVIK